MMKKLISAVAVFTVIFFLIIPVSAQNEKYIYDNAELLSDMNKEVVEALLKQLNTDYGVSMYVITRQSDDEKDDLTAVQYSEKFCADNNLGKDGDKGLLAVLDVDKTISLFYPYGGGDLFTNDFLNGLFNTVNMYYSGGEFYIMYQELSAQVDEYLYKKVGLQDQPNIVDNAQLLSEEEESLLIRKINNILETYNFEVAIFTTDSIGNKTIVEYADDTYDYGGYGFGANKDGLAFVLNMGERDYYTTTCGYGITAFTDYGIEKMCEDVVPLLTEGSYYSAFDVYLDNVLLFLEQAKKGEPFDVGNKMKTTADYFKSEIVVIIVSLIISTITAFSFRSSMNNARVKKSAGNYIKKDSMNISKGSDCGINLTNSSDVFMYSTTAKTARQTSSSSGGSSTHSGSSGMSHGGGGGKF